MKYICSKGKVAVYNSPLSSANDACPCTSWVVHVDHSAFHIIYKKPLLWANYEACSNHATRSKTEIHLRCHLNVGDTLPVPGDDFIKY